jgi:hypothetical protein
MQTTYRDLLTSIHGILFGGFFLMAFFAIALELLRSAYTPTPTKRARTLESLFLITTALFGWLAVISGTFIVYPWYRATPPPNAQTLTPYPRAWLLAHPATAQLHSIGMEWKEHIGWLAPILATMAAYILISQRNILQQNPRLRRAVILFAFTGLFATGIAGLTGALLDKSAPVTGGNTITTGSTQ